MVMGCGGCTFDKVPAITPAMFRIMTLVGTLVGMLVCHVFVYACVSGDCGYCLGLIVGWLFGGLVV